VRDDVAEAEGVPAALATPGAGSLVSLEPASPIGSSKLI
jgi:hypothetical protein